MMNPTLPASNESVSAMTSEEEGAGNESISLPASTFATTPKEGERLTFCVTGGDEENVTGYWMAAEPKEETQEDYDAGLKKSMREATETPI
jgi:hypothetical protein